MAVFGQSPFGIHLGLLAVNVVTVLLIFFLVRSLLGELAALTAAASYAVLSVSPTVLGFAGHATHFVVLSVVAGIFLLWRAEKRDSIPASFVSGMLFGLGVLMKQPGAAFAVFASLYLIVGGIMSRHSARRIVIRLFAFVTGVIIPIGVALALLWWAGAFDSFWLWSIEYAHQYGTRVSVRTALDVFKEAFQPAVGLTWPIWALAGIGLLATIWKQKERTHVLVLAMTIGAAVSVCAGFYFRPHYFILLLPALALLVGVVVAQTQTIRAWPARTLILLVVFAAISYPMFAMRHFFFAMPLDRVSRLTSGPNPFVESSRIAEFIRARTEPSDTIAVLGSEPQIYFLAQRHSATGYIYMYPLMDPQAFAEQMQKQMIAEIEESRPRVVVFVAIGTSWLTDLESRNPVFDWFQQYSARELEPIGFVNIVSDEQVDYYLPYAGETIPPSRFRVLIFRRKS